MKVSCPFCGSENVSEQERIDNYPVPFCVDAEIKHNEYYCSECEEEGDFDGTADDEILANIKRAGVASAARLMEDLVENGITMSYFEKALRIPFRTTSRWKRGEISQSALALLRLIRFSPHLLHVADNNFSEEAQATYQLTRPCHYLRNRYDNASGTIDQENGNIVIRYFGSQGIQTPVQVDTGTQTLISVTCATG